MNIKKQLQSHLTFLADCYEFEFGDDLDPELEEILSDLKSYFWFLTEDVVDDDPTLRIYSSIHSIARVAWKAAKAEGREHSSLQELNPQASVYNPESVRDYAIEALQSFNDWINLKMWFQKRFVYSLAV